MTVIEHVAMGSRFTDKERELYGAGLCCHQTGYGLPWSTYCERALTTDERGRGSVECTEHETENADAFGRVLRLGFVTSAADTAPGDAVGYWDDSLRGVVAETGPAGVTVDWGSEQTRGVPGSRYTLFLAGSLRDGVLVRMETTS